MRKLFYLITVLTIFGCKSNNVKIEVDNVDKGIACLYNTVSGKTDSIKFSDHSFSFSLKELKEPTLFYLMFDKVNNIDRPIYLILSNKETQVSFTDLVAVNESSADARNLYPNKPEFVSDPNFNKAFYLFQDLFIGFLNDVSRPDLDLERRKEIYTRFISGSGELIIKNNDKLVAALIVEYLMKNELIQLEKIQFLYSNLSPNIQKTIIGQRISDEVGFETQSFAPKFSFRDFHGNIYSLDSLKGKKVLLHFWSSTCAPCIKEIPTLLKLTVEKKDLVIINISLDTERNRWVSGMEKLGIGDMINFCDYNGTNGKITKDYHINSIPANYLLDENGKVLSKEETLQGLIDKL